jgi:hypothetical protein
MKYGFPDQPLPVPNASPFFAYKTLNDSAIVVGRGFVPTAREEGNKGGKKEAKEERAEPLPRAAFLVANDSQIIVPVQGFVFDVDPRSTVVHPITSTLFTPARSPLPYSKDQSEWMNECKLMSS